MNNYYENIHGWFTDNEAIGLYETVSLLKDNDRVLEIGFLFGRSTSVICDAISSKKINFDSYDIGFKNEEDFHNFYDNIHGRISVPDLLTDVSFKTKIPIIDLARNNLKKFDLLKFVNLKCENFHTIVDKKYNLIFCDALHDQNEIRINLPKILELSEKNTVFCFHDMSFTNIEQIKSIGNLIHLKNYDNLGIFINQQ